MIYQIILAVIVLVILFFVIYFFFPVKEKGIPKEPAKKPIPKIEDVSVPYYSEGEVIVEDELYGMKMIWDDYEDKVENFIRFLENSKSVDDPKVISRFQEIEGEYVRMKTRLRPFLRENMTERMDERILYTKNLIRKKFRY